jgi:hypothetical protein
MSQPVATPTPVASPIPAAPAINANMTLAQIDNALGRMATLEDLVAAGIPQQVAQDMIDADAGGGAPSAVVDSLPPVSGAPKAEPNLRPVGTAMDLDFFNQLNSAQSQEEFNAMYDALPAVQQFVYDRSFGQKITPAWAAQKADEFFKSQSEQNSPKAVAETDAAFARAQRAFGATQKIDYAIKRIMGEEDKPRYKSYVGAYSMSPLGLVPGTETRQFQTDLASLKALLGLAAAGETKGQGQVSNYERELYGAASSIGLDLANTEESFKETLLQIKKQNDAQMAENESMLNRLQGKRPAAAGQSQPQSAADEPADTRPRKTLMGTTYAVNADGTLKKVAK